jgi:hypothetical protein
MCFYRALYYKLSGIKFDSKETDKMSICDMYKTTSKRAQLKVTREEGMEYKNILDFVL